MQPFLDITASHAILEQHQQQLISSLLTVATGTDTGPPETGGLSYSKASYYTILGLYVLCFPGVWSQVKRSTAAKIKRKTYQTTTGKSLRQQAGEIMACTFCCIIVVFNYDSHSPLSLTPIHTQTADMTSNNYEVVDAGETITFRGIVKRSAGQAAFLVFCTALGLLSLALVLQVQFNDLDFNWYSIAALSPLAGVYYWSAGDRVDDISVKLVALNEAETENEIVVEGNDEELERMWRTLEWTEKGMVKIPGLLEQP